MTEDDLDAFFEEVSAVEAEVKEEETKKDDEDGFKPPPAKKLKRPVGVVVAASSSKVSIKPAVPDEKEQEEKPLQEKPVPHSLDVSGASGESTQHSSEQTQIPATDGETKKPHIRAAAGKVWKDTSLSDWPENDYRLFVGNLSKDVTDPQLYEHFAQFPSLQMVKVIRDPKGTSKGYGFVSLMDPIECAIAIREMDQTWLSSRPIKVKRSDWKDRELKNVKKKQRQIHRKMNRSL